MSLDVLSIVVALLLIILLSLSLFLLLLLSVKLKFFYVLGFCFLDVSEGLLGGVPSRS